MFVLLAGGGFKQLAVVGLVDETVLLSSGRAQSPPAAWLAGAVRLQGVPHQLASTRRFASPGAYQLTRCLPACQHPPPRLPPQMYATWCAGCKALLPHLIQLAEADPSVRWLNIDYGALLIWKLSGATPLPQRSATFAAALCGLPRHAHTPRPAVPPRCPRMVPNIAGRPLLCWHMTPTLLAACWLSHCGCART